MPGSACNEVMAADRPKTRHQKKTELGLPASVSPERQLWCAVLLRALDDIAERRTASKWDGWWQDEAVKWFRSIRYRAGSFLWICDQLDLHPASIRKRVFGNNTLQKTDKEPFTGFWSE